MDILKCEHEYRDIGLVLCTVPETKIQACIHCGKQRAKQDELKEGQTTSLPCDICQSPMSITEQDGKTYFKCTSSSCGQIWIFMKDGEGNISSFCTILKALWPSGMKEDSKMFREEYLPSWLESKEFYAEAVTLAGFWTQEEKHKFLFDVLAEFTKWHKEHPLPAPPAKPWWKFW
jgi:hypothetical protein